MRIVDMIRHAREHQGYLLLHAFDVVVEMESIARRRDRDRSLNSDLRPRGPNDNVFGAD